MSSFDLAYLSGAISHDALIASLIFRDDMANVEGKRCFPYPTPAEATIQINAIKEQCKTNAMVFKDRIKSHCRATQNYRHFGLLHLNACDETNMLADDNVPFLLSKRKMLERYEESRRKVVDSEGKSLMKILTKSAKLSLGSGHLKLSTIDLHVGLLPDEDQLLLVPPSSVSEPLHHDIISIIASCGQSDAVRDDLFNTLMNASHNADRVIRVSTFL